MSNLLIKNNIKKRKCIVRNEIKFPEAIQERLLPIINSGRFDSFLPVVVIKRSKRAATLECRLDNFLPLSNYLRSLVTFNDFLEILYCIIDSIKVCNKSLLNQNNIELNLDSIFIEPSSKIIKLIYWPVVNLNNYIPQKNFFMDIFHSTNFASIDKTFQKQYLDFFNTLMPFSLNNFEKLILEMQGKKVQTADISPSSNLLNEDGTSSSLQPVVSKGKDLTYDPVALSTSAKVVSATASAINNRVAVLKRVSNDEIVTINSGVFKIGKSEADNNYAIVDNSAISRKHAEILTISDGYFIVDCNSTNGVKINGKKIKPSVEYKIKRGDKIHLANEEFLVE